jgi:hypothetical protein
VHALETAAALAGVEEDKGTEVAKSAPAPAVASRLALAVECGLAGLQGAAARCLAVSGDQLGAGAGGVGVSLHRCMTLVARAAVKCAEGNAGEAMVVLEDKELAALAADRFRALKEGRDDIVGLYAAVKCEVVLQQGQGLAAARQAVAAVHGMLGGAAGPSRMMAAAASSATSSAAAASAASAADEEEEAAVAVAARGESGAVDMSAYGRMVCSRSGEASHFRQMHQVARALARAGEVYTVMGLAREAGYYLEQGMQVAKGCASVYWHTRFLRLLAALRLVEQDLESARQYVEQASIIIETATRVAHHPTDPLTFLAAERFHVDMLSTRIFVEQHNTKAARQALEAARTSLASTRARAAGRAKESQRISPFMQDVCSQTLGSSAWLVDLLAGGCVGEVGKGTKAASYNTSAATVAPVVDWRIKYGFKQPAPSVKSRSSVASVSSTAAPKNTKSAGTTAVAAGNKGAKEQQVGVGGERGGSGEEKGFAEMLAAHESDLLMLEGNQDEALALLGRALHTQDKRNDVDATCARGGLGWAEVELHLRLGVGLLARAEQNADQNDDQVLTNLGKQLLEISLESVDSGVQNASGSDDDDDVAGAGDGEVMLSEKELNAMKVTELKLLLEARGLATAGRKADLIQRFLSHSSPSSAKNPKATASTKSSKTSKAKTATKAVNAPAVLLNSIFSILIHYFMMSILLIMFVCFQYPKDGRGKEETARASSEMRGSVAQGGCERQEGVRMLLTAWKSCHPAGPPLLIRCV